MTTEQQQVAMIQTLLHFIGVNNYKPSSSAVLAYLREVSGQTPSTWDVSKNKNQGTPASGATQGWDVKSNNKNTSGTPAGGAGQGWDVKSNNKGTSGTAATVSHTHPAAQKRN